MKNSKLQFDDSASSQPKGAEAQLPNVFLGPSPFYLCH